MSNFKVKYVSQVNLDKNWVYAPGQWFKLNWVQLNTEFQNPACYLVALDEKQLNFLHHLVSVFPKYYRNWGYSKDTLNEAVWDDIQTWVSEVELCLMSGCAVSDLKTSIDRLTAAVAGETITVDVNGTPTEFNYSLTGISPILHGIRRALSVDNLIYPDMSLAEILQAGLIGRQIDIPWPFEGEGLADIADEQLTALHNRFRMADATIFNPGGEKNITEALETLLRVDKLTDLEFLLPNITTVLNNTLKVQDDGLLSQLWQAMFPEYAESPPPEGNTIAELLLGVVRAINELYDMKAKLEEIRTLYETRSLAETTAANTRNDEQIAVLNAIEDVLGGDWEPPE